MKNLRKTLKIGFVTLGLLGLAISTLLAQDLPDRGPVPFATYDINGDGYVSQKEFYDIRDARMQQKATAGMPMRNAANAPDFSALDKDKDGKLSELELLRGQNEQMQKNKGNKGYNNMGNRAAQMPAFESFDTNKDGMLNKQELNESRDKRMEQKAADGKMLKNSANRMPFEDIDANGDGQISKEEFLNHQMRRK